MTADPDKNQPPVARHWHRPLPGRTSADVSETILHAAHSKQTQQVLQIAVQDRLIPCVKNREGPQPAARPETCFPDPGPQPKMGDH
jgi:hypothetical protein